VDRMIQSVLSDIYVLCVLRCEYRMASVLLVADWIASLLAMKLSCWRMARRWSDIKLKKSQRSSDGIILLMIH